MYNVFLVFFVITGNMNQIGLNFDQILHDRHFWGVIKVFLRLI